jgi:hypothetical protein
VILDAVGRHFADVAREIREARFTGHRARVCMRTALSVVLAVTLAQWAALDDAWWAGISGFMASQATRPASIRRSILRVAGTRRARPSAMRRRHHADAGDLEPVRAAQPDADGHHGGRGDGGAGARR